MSEPTDPVPQRIGDAERDQATTYLREALAHGRLDQAEFDDRVDQALRAKTQADLDPLFRDLPGPKPGQGLAASGGFQAPPWQRAAQPPDDVAVPSGGAAVAKSDASRFLDIVAWAAWPVTIIALFATNWHFWWLIFIPIFISSFAGTKHHGGHRDRDRRS